MVIRRNIYIYSSESDIVNLCSSSHIHNQTCACTQKRLYTDYIKITRRNTRDIQILA